MENVLRSISSQGISAQDKIEIMQQAVARYPKISFFQHGGPNPIFIGLRQQSITNLLLTIHGTSAA